MVEQPIGVRTPTAIKVITAIAKLIWYGLGTTQFLFFAVKDDFIKTYRDVPVKFLATDRAASTS